VVGSTFNLKRYSANDLLKSVALAALFTLLIGCDSASITGAATAPTDEPTTSTAVSLQAETQEPEQPEVSQSTPIPSSPPTLSDVTDLILVTGQSNTLGAGTEFDASLDTPNNAVFAFTNNGWKVADLHQVWDGRWYPRSQPGTDPSNNFALHFGKHVVERDATRVVAFVLMSAPGQAIGHWQSDQQYFSEIRNTVTRAINELPNKVSVDGILWHQGESDGVVNDYYSEALYDLIEDFRSEPWFGYERPFICGETAQSPVNHQLRRLNHDNNPWTACVAAEGLSTVRDDAHFSAESLRTIGRRYGDAYLQMTR